MKDIVDLVSLRVNCNVNKFLAMCLNGIMNHLKCKH